VSRTAPREDSYPFIKLKRFTRVFPLAMLRLLWQGCTSAGVAIRFNPLSPLLARRPGSFLSLLPSSLRDGEAPGSRHRRERARVLDSLDRFPADFMSDREQPSEAEQRDSLE
jgi:hypothetical protein